MEPSEYLIVRWPYFEWWLVDRGSWEITDALIVMRKSDSRVPGENS